MTQLLLIHKDQEKKQQDLRIRQTLVQEQLEKKEAISIQLLEKGQKQKDNLAVFDESKMLYLRKTLQEMLNILDRLQ